MSKRNVRIALLVIFKEMSPPDIAAKYDINLSRVYQITQSIKRAYGWREGMAPNEFSRRIARAHEMNRHLIGAHRLQTPAHMYCEILREEELDRDRAFHDWELNVNP